MKKHSAPKVIGSTIPVCRSFAHIQALGAHAVQQFLQIFHRGQTKAVFHRADPAKHLVVFAVARVMHYKGHQPAPVVGPGLADPPDLLAACGSVGKKRGQQALGVVKTGNTDKPKLLLIRDSYSDSLVPFLTPHFSEIHLIDLRYYKLSASQYIADKGIDQALVLYSVPNFVSDANLVWLGR